MGVGGRFDFTRQPCDHLSVVGRDVVLRGLCVDGARVFFDVCIGSVVPHRSSLGGMDSLFVGVCPPGWWVIEQSPSHGGEVLSRGGEELCLMVKITHEQIWNTTCAYAGHCRRPRLGGLSSPLPACLDLCCLGLRCLRQTMGRRVVRACR